jgi:hypothetical protein
MSQLDDVVAQIGNRAVTGCVGMIDTRILTVFGDILVRSQGLLLSVGNDHESLNISVSIYFSSLKELD